MSEPVTASGLTSPKTHLPAASRALAPQRARARAAESGEAMADGSFPIRDGADLKRAIQSFGRAKDKGAARRHIIRRARTLGRIELLPESWQDTATKSFPGEVKLNEPQTVIASAPTALDDQLLLKAERHNARASEDRQVSVAKLKAVYRRGLSEFTVRPCVTPEQYAHSRVNSFLRLLSASGPDSVSYVGDNDLLPASHPARQVVLPFV